jgi:hypothetical protein
MPQSALGPTQHPIQWITGVEPQGYEADHTHPFCAEVKDEWSSTSSFVCLRGLQDNFTLFHYFPLSLLLSIQKNSWPAKHSAWKAIVRYHLGMLMKLQKQLSALSCLSEHSATYINSAPTGCNLMKLYLVNTIIDCWMPPSCNSWRIACSFCLVHLLHLAAWLE